MRGSKQDRDIHIRDISFWICEAKQVQFAREIERRIVVRSSYASMITASRQPCGLRNASGGLKDS
jgi:hypothetical protein